MGPVLSCIQQCHDHLEQYAKPRPVDTNIIVGNGKSRVVPEPYGACLVIGSWNYPWFTTVAVAAEAIAAGNCVCLKPSELSPKSSNVMKELFEKYMD